MATKETLNPAALAEAKQNGKPADGQPHAANGNGSHEYNAESIKGVDNGRGIPVDDMVSDDEKVPAAQVVMTKLHAGGKFDSSSYKVSGGLHGVGVSCVNALSEELELEIKRDGFTWEQSYSEGEPKTKLKKTGPAKKTG